MENTPLHCLRAFQWTPAEHRERLVESAEQSLSWRLVATTLIDPTNDSLSYRALLEVGFLSFLLLSTRPSYGSAPL